MPIPSIGDDFEEIDVLFEGHVVFLHESDVPTIWIATDGCFEIGLPAALLVNVDDGDHIDVTPAGEAVRQLLKPETGRKP